MFELKDFIKATGEVELYWGDKMPMMAAEEMAELIQAVSKLERTDKYDEELVGHVAEEIRDVIISIGALMHRYGITYPDLAEMVVEKLNEKYE